MLVTTRHCVDLPAATRGSHPPLWFLHYGSPPDSSIQSKVSLAGARFGIKSHQTPQQSVINVFMSLLQRTGTLWSSLLLSHIQLLCWDQWKIQFNHMQYFVRVTSRKQYLWQKDLCWERINIPSFPLIIYNRIKQYGLLFAHEQNIYKLDLLSYSTYDHE